MSADDQAELMRLAAFFFNIGRVTAELHAMGGALPAENLFDPHNYGSTPARTGLRISSAGMAHVSFAASEAGGLTVAQRVGAMKDAAMQIPRPVWDVFAAGYRERGAEIGQTEVTEVALQGIDATLELVETARSAHARALEDSAAGRFDESVALLREEIASWEQAGMENVAGRARINLGADLASMDRLAEAEASYDQAYEIAKKHADTYGLMMACASLALHHQNRGDLAKARGYATEGQALMKLVKLPGQDAQALRRVFEQVNGKRRLFWP